MTEINCPGMLIVLGGLPGVGKTTIARELARGLGAVHIRIDSIEQGVRQSGVTARSIGDAGYRVGYAVVEDNLRVGRTVIADSVNPIPLTRDAWLGVALRAGTPVVEIELSCSDEREHRRRIERRLAEPPEFTGPTWDDVISRDYRVWDREHLVIDTAGATVAHTVAELRAALRSSQPPHLGCD
ncbi:MAG: AAA family ATPase [Acidobacteriota bacterium]